MKAPRRLRFRLRTLLVLVTATALLLGWWMRERKKRVEALLAERQVQAARVRWARRMNAEGYVPRSRLTAERKALTETDRKLQDLGAAPGPALKSRHPSGL